MTNEQIEEIDQACGEGCGVVCAFFVRRTGEGKLRPNFIEDKPYLGLGLGEFLLDTRLYGDDLLSAIQSLIFKGVLETRSNGVKYFAYYYFNVIRLKRVLTRFKRMQQRLKIIRRIGSVVHKTKTK